MFPGLELSLHAPVPIVLEKYVVALIGFNVPLHCKETKCTIGFYWHLKIIGILQQCILLMDMLIAVLILFDTQKYDNTQSAHDLN